MGITNLPKMLKKYAPKQKLESLVSYSPGGNVLGIDMSTAIVAAARSQRGAEEYHQRAPVPAHHVAAQCLRLINKLTKLSFAVYPVFDGLTRTPLKKSKAAKVRDKPIEKHYNALRELLGTPWPRRKDAQVELLKKITQARKGSAKADASVVATLVNVFEENGIENGQVLASQRGQTYRVYLVLNRNGSYIKAPYSRCSCAAGNLFCAHMLGLLCLCRVVQKNPSWTRIDLQQKLRSNTELLQRQVIPVSSLFKKRMNRRKK